MVYLSSSTVCSGDIKINKKSSELVIFRAFFSSPVTQNQKKIHVNQLIKKNSGLTPGLTTIERAHKISVPKA